MEAEWRNRIIGVASQHPEAMPFLGLWCSIKDGSAWPGSEEDLENPESSSEPTETICQSLRSLADRIEPLLGETWRSWEKLVPLDPTITSDLALSGIENSLIDALPHLETLSHNPRGHLTIEEIREDVSRARRVSHRAVASLAAHSEDWQTRNFLGVRPRRVLAESRRDQWDIYENRAVATLRKRILGVLHPRLQKLNQILHAFDEASEHSSAMRGTRFRCLRLYQLWGEVFTGHPGRELLVQLIQKLEAARARLLALADTFLFHEMRQFSVVESPLHSTNVFQSDAHYRQVFHLWHKWERITSVKAPTPAERAAKRRRSCEDWNLFVLLLAIRACRQLGLAPADKLTQPLGFGAPIRLVRNWTLQIQTDHSLLLAYNGAPQLRIVGVYTSWRARTEEHVSHALNALLGSEQSDSRILIVSVDDAGQATASWSPLLQDKFTRLSSATLLSDKIGFAEVSPLKIDSTELVARAIRWVTAEVEWPKLPLRNAIPGWSQVWPELSSRDGIKVSGQDLLFHQAPSKSLLADAQKRASAAKQKREQIVAEREQLKSQEQRVRGDKSALATINRRKKELGAEDAETQRLSDVLVKIEESLVEVRGRFLLLERCPCCNITQVQKQEDANMMHCQCGTEWGRRTCPTCQQDYAFIVPYVKDLKTMREKVDPIRVFGADMCAFLSLGESIENAANAPECPSCNGLERFLLIRR
ncbi:MAG: hypothetical protein ABMA26_09125 [Limisphaerales bacterium]